MACPNVPVVGRSRADSALRGAQLKLRRDMTLELSQLTHQVGTMGSTLAERQQTYAGLADLGWQWLADFADQGPVLRSAADLIQAAIPTDEPLDLISPLPGVPDSFTVVAADGSQIQPDRHGPALYHLINIGSLVYRHGSGEAPEASSEATLGYAEDDLYENGVLVAGNLLDVRRDVAELKRLADACQAPQSSPVAALVDGPLVLWVLQDLPGGAGSSKVKAYLDQLERIRRAGAIVGGFVSRPGYTEVTRLLQLASVAGDVERCKEQPGPLERLPDRSVFTKLPPGARSALFVSPKAANHEYYTPRGHQIYFFYLNLAQEEQKPVIGRVEVPSWVAEQAANLDLIHGAIVVQARITGDYPYALARADELAYITRREREAFESMVLTALLKAGVSPAPSPKASYKRLTRRGY